MDAGVHVCFSVYATHVRSCPLLTSQLLLLGVGGCHFQVEHWLQPGRASINPLTPLIILININQHRAFILFSWSINFNPAYSLLSLHNDRDDSWSFYESALISECFPHGPTRKSILTKLPSTSSTLLFHQVPSHSVLMICPTFRSTIGLLG